MSREVYVQRRSLHSAAIAEAELEERGRGLGEKAQILH